MVAYLVIHTDKFVLAKMDVMSASDFLEYIRKLHQHSFHYHFTVFLLLGGAYLAVIEFIAYVIGLVFKKPAPHTTNSSS